MEIVVGADRCDVRCRPQCLSKISLFTAFFIVERAGASPIHLTYFARRWRRQTFDNVGLLFQFLTSLQGHGVDAFATDETRLLNRVSQDTHRFSGRFEFAQAEAQAVRDIADLTARYNELFHGRWTICEVDNDAATSIVVAMGKQYPPLNTRWYKNPVGQSVHQYADFAYGEWVAALQRRVCLTGVAEVDDVDALVEFPEIGRVRLRYSRASVPLQTRHRRSYLLSITESNALIDLRGSAAT